jgi:hypothetical protein
VMSYSFSAADGRIVDHLAAEAVDNGSSARDSDGKLRKVDDEVERSPFA